MLSLYRHFATKMKKQHYLRNSLVFLGIAIVLFLGFELVLRNAMKSDLLARRIQRSVNQVERQLQEVSEGELSGEALAKQQVGLFVFNADSLVYWNTNIIGQRLLKRRVTMGRDTICNLLSGDFFVKSFVRGQQSYYLFKLLNTTYGIENDYFKNRYWPFHTMLDARLYFGRETEDAYPISGISGNTLSYCQMKVRPLVEKPFSYLQLLLFIMIVAGFYLVLYHALLQSQWLTERKEWIFILFLVISALALFLWQRFRPDFLLFKTDFYQQMAQGGVDAPIGILLEITAFFAANLFLAARLLNGQHCHWHYIWKLILAFSAFMAYAFITLRLMPSLFSSSMSQEPAFYTMQLTGQSYLLLLFASVVQLAFVMVLNAIMQALSINEKPRWQSLLLFAIVLAPAFYFFMGRYFVVYVMLVALFALILYRDRIGQGGRLLPIILQLLVVAAMMTHSLYKVRKDKESAFIQASAASLVDKQDAAFEQSYETFFAKLQSDDDLREMVFSESNVLADVILGYSQELLFDTVMKAYTSSLTLCLPGEEIAVQPEGFVTDCDAYFTEILASHPNTRIGNGLFFVDYNTLDPNYLAKIKVCSADSLQVKTLYFEFYKPVVPQGFGFPRLLQSQSSRMPYDNSVARYRDNLLVYKYGKYIYPNFLNDLNCKDHEFTNGRRNRHYAIFEDENDAFVMSARRPGWSEVTAPFALFFLLLLLPFLIIYLINREKNDGSDRHSFRWKLQLVVLLTLAISFLVVGPVSVLFMRSLYNQKTSANAFETSRTLLLEMENEIDLRGLNETMPRSVWTELLQHFSSTFFTDINLYGPDGRLMATTRPEVYENHLQSPLMDADAYQHMHGSRALYFTHEEHMGRGVYESAYLPVTNENGMTMAYLNVPYFSSKFDLRSEILNFMLTYVNIILLLVGLSVLLVLAITRRLTEPLALIQHRMGDIKIDSKNEPIEWQGNDEIGALVKQYNQLIVQLEQSAAELRRTTTESAWRGVARQVAHEIKNSLTPMRLSVQLLQRSMENGDNDVEERIKRTSATLIEQIDALSDIASSFSQFAKLPENNPMPLNLAELLGNVVNLYDNVDNITFTYVFDKSGDYVYNGDKTNLNSAFGNIIKNATQAIGSKPDGKIDIELKNADHSYVVSISDNGKGIKEEDKNQIFLPNFTTKTGGSGVGLSLTYNIIQVAGGTIDFESEEGVGTKFIIELFKN